MIIKICVGSSCHLKGSREIVELFKEAIKKDNLDCCVTLAACFCAGKCNRDGVTVSVDDTVYTGITIENFTSFYNEKVLMFMSKERK